jgi:hypothetical protein
MQNLIRTATVLVLFGAPACSYLGADPDGGGNPKPNQDQEVANPPQWWCRDRIDPNIELLSDIVDIGEDETGDGGDGGSVHPAEVETCVFAPATNESDPWPGKPWWVGLPLVELEPLDLVNAHPMYTREAIDEMTNQPTVIVAGDGDIRSGLIGNFAIWPFSILPTSGLRPPIVTGTFLDLLTAIEDPDTPTILGDPFNTGRYNAYGQPCSSSSYIPDWFHSMIEDHVGSQPNALECAAMVTWQHAEPLGEEFPFPDSEDPSYDGTVRAAGATRCLDNGGQYLPGLAAVTMADRNGLLWLNWDELDQVKLWVAANTVGNDLLATILVAFDFFESKGESLYWPLNPAWPWSRWSYTGICAHPAELRLADNDTKIKTWLGCPRGMVPVMPEVVDPPQQPDPNWKHEGFCTFPYQMPPSDGAAGPTLFPELKIGKPGHGFDGAIYVAPLSRETALRWVKSIKAIPTPDGLEIHAVNDLGRALLHTVSLPDGALLRSMHGERLERDPLAVILQIDRQLAAGRLVLLWFESPDRRRVIPRYFVPTDHIKADRILARLSKEARKHADEVADTHLAERFAKDPFGPRLVELRTRRQWSREQLSEASKLDLATIEAIETGEITPDSVMMARLWRGLGIRFYSELFKDPQE